MQPKRRNFKVTWVPLEVLILNRAPKIGHSYILLLIYPSHTRQIQIETEISSVVFSYRFFLFLSLLIILNFDASDVGMYVGNYYINYKYSCSFPCIYLRVTLSVLQEGRPGGRFSISGRDNTFLSPPKRPHWLLISASLLYDGCHTIYSLGCISRIGVRRNLQEVKAIPLLAWTGP